MNFIKNKYTKIFAGIFLALALVFTGLMGYFHTPSGSKSSLAKTLMPYLGYKCPIDLVTYETVSQGRMLGLAANKGQEPAALKIFLDFDLNSAKYAEVLSKAKTQSASCKESAKGFKTITCNSFKFQLSDSKSGVSFDENSTEVVFTFDNKDQLIAISNLVHPKSAELAVGNFQSKRKFLASYLGTAHNHIGEGVVSDLASDFSAVSIGYKFSDLFIQVSLTKMQSRFIVYEQYYLNNFTSPVALNR